MNTIKIVFSITLLSSMQLGFVKIGFCLDDAVALAELIAITQKHIRETKSIVESTSKVMRVLGNPKQSIQGIQDLGDAIDQFDRIIHSEESHSINKVYKSGFDLAKDFQSLTQTIEKSINGSDGETQNYTFYQTYSKINDLYRSFDRILTEDKKIQQAEINRQNQLFETLNQQHGLTPDERAQVLVAIETSKGVQSASTNRVLTASTIIEQEYKAKQLNHELDSDLQHEERIRLYNEKVKFNRKKAEEENEKLKKLFLTEESYTRKIKII